MAMLNYRTQLPAQGDIVTEVKIWEGSNAARITFGSGKGITVHISEGQDPEEIKKEKEFKEHLLRGIIDGDIKSSIGYFIDMFHGHDKNYHLNIGAGIITVEVYDKNPTKTIKTYSAQIFE